MKNFWNLTMKYLFKIIFKLTHTFYVFSNKLYIYLIEIHSSLSIYLRFYLYVENEIDYI